MGEAVLSVVAGPVISSLVQDVLGSAGGSNGAGGGLFDSLFKNFTSAFAGLLGGGGASSGQPSSTPMPYSTAQMSPAVYNNPMAYVDPAVSQYNGYYNGDTIVRDHRHPTNGDTIVHDHRHPVATGGTAISTGTSEDATDDAALNAQQSLATNADNLAMQNPNNLADQNDAQRKDLALQNLMARLTEKNKIKADMAHQALQESKLG